MWWSWGQVFQANSLWWQLAWRFQERAGRSAWPKSTEQGRVEWGESWEPTVGCITYDLVVTERNGILSRMNVCRWPVWGGEGFRLELLYKLWESKEEAGNSVRRALPMWGGARCGIYSEGGRKGLAEGLDVEAEQSQRWSLSFLPSWTTWWMAVPFPTPTPHFSILFNDFKMTAASILIKF